MKAPDAAVIALLRADPIVGPAVGGRISTDMRPGPSCIRVSLIGGGEPFNEWVRATVQVECWATDQLVAGQLAFTVRQRWPLLRGNLDADTHVVGCWVESDPTFLPDPDSDRPRYLLTVGLTMGQR